MTCDQAAEFVSALCDGETIPRVAAEHLSGCEACRTLLRSYSDLGAELRFAASVALTEEAPVRVWRQRPGIWRNWWRKGWEGMRIPRFVFASMLVGIVVLGSGLAVIGVHARGEGNVILLKISPPGGQPIVCPLSTVDKKLNSCAVVSRALTFEVKALSKDGDRVNVGVRAKYESPQIGNSYDSLASIEGLPEEQYSFEPGKALRVDVAGLGALTITGEWIDHIPVMIGGGQNLDPGPDELRIVSPVLLRGKEVAGDMEGGSALADKPGESVNIFLPGEGQFQFSLSQTPGAVQAHVQLNRISFESNGQLYALVTGVPITREKQVWVRHDANFKPSGGAEDGSIGVTDFANAAPDRPIR
ncbi:MAG TPA: hypothetical protein VGM27_04520 [Acidobacteriaceae bacterium]